MASYFMNSVVFSRDEGECKYSLTSEITWPYSTTSVISGLFSILHILLLSRKMLPFWPGSQ